LIDDVTYAGKLSNRFRLLTSWRRAGTHYPVQQVEIMNAPKLYLLKRDHGPKYQAKVH